jgi:hypothetical protein
VNTVTLYRPVGEAELELIARSGNRRFPPRLSGQPFFYPVCTREYAEQIAQDWNARDGGSGYVTRFEVTSEFLAPYRIHAVGTSLHSEYWIPAEDLPAFNDSIVGTIETISRFGPADDRPQQDAAPKGRGSGMFAVTLDTPHKKTGEGC